MSKDYRGSANSHDRQSAARSGLATGKVRWYAIVSLVIIAACLAEFLTGSTPILAAFTIAIPLILVELSFPETKGRRLLASRGLTLTGVLYGLTVFVLTFFLGDPYVPSLGVDLFLVAYASAFIIAAYLVPRSFLQAKRERPDTRERNFILLGLGFMGGFFLISGTLAPGGGFVARLLFWQVTAVMIVPLAGLAAWYLVRHAGQSENDLVKVDFLLGITLVFVPIDVLLELGGDIGVLAFTAIIIGTLIRLRLRVKRTYQSPPVSRVLLSSGSQSLSLFVAILISLLPRKSFGNGVERSYPGSFPMDLFSILQLPPSEGHGPCQIEGG